MHVPILIRSIIAVGCIAVSGPAQSPPPNDNYADRIMLQGEDISFNGALAGATLEAAPYEVVPLLNSPYPAQTVWWEWMPTQTTTVILRILNPLSPSELVDAVQVYQLESIDTGRYVEGILIDTHFPQIFFTFYAQAGTNYQIQLAGSDGASFDLHLIATDLPFVVQQPQTQTVSTGDSVMFGVVVAGAKPFSYQWQRHGTNLIGETAPTLGLDNVTMDQAGEYRVEVSNSAGTVVSQSAELFVTSADPAASLAVTQPAFANGFSFAIVGETGRRYRIESSTNLLNWLPEASFPTDFYTPFTGLQEPKSVVSDSTGTNIYSHLRTARQKYFRASPFHAVNEECNNNLKRIRFAQLLYSYERQLPRWASVTHVDLAPYLKSGQFPECPTAGLVTVTTVLANPLCSLHPFEEP